MNSPLHSGTSARSYDPFAGNQPSPTDSTAMQMSPSQKYGTAEKNVDSGSRESAQVPRRQPMPVPMSVPMMKLMTVARPTRPTVHGSACRMMSATGVGKSMKETP